MNTNITKEKRRAPRINAKFPIQYQIKRGGFFASALTQDISLSGAKINVDRSFPKGLNLNLELNILSKIIKPVARVIWTQALLNSEQHQMGVEFINLNAQDKSCLSEYINLHTTNLENWRNNG